MELIGTKIANGRYLISNHHFNITMSLSETNVYMAGSNIDNIGSYGATQADVVEVDENSFKAIFNIEDIEVNTIYCKPDIDNSGCNSYGPTLTRSNISDVNIIDTVETLNSINNGMSDFVGKNHKVVLCHFSSLVNDDIKEWFANRGINDIDDSISRHNPLLVECIEWLKEDNPKYYKDNYEIVEIKGSRYYKIYDNGMTERLIEPDDDSWVDIEKDNHVE